MDYFAIFLKIAFDHDDTTCTMVAHEQMLVA